MKDSKCYQDTLEKYKNFCRAEYAQFLLFFNSDLRRKRFDDIFTIEKEIQYLLGVSQFVQELGVPFKEVDKIYNYYRIKLEELEKGE